MEFRLKEIRKELGKTQLEVANILNVKRGTYASWECETDIIPMKQLYNLAMHYNISIDYLLNLSTEKINIEKTNLNLKEVGINLKKIRKELKLSQNEIGSNIGINQSTWWGYENGINLITTTSLLALNKIYKCKIDDIFNLKTKSLTS